MLIIDFIFFLNIYLVYPKYYYFVNHFSIIVGIFLITHPKKYDEI